MRTACVSLTDRFLDATYRSRSNALRLLSDLHKDTYTYIYKIQYNIIHIAIVHITEKPYILQQHMRFSNVTLALGAIVLNGLPSKGVRKCRAIILGELFHVRQEARVSADFMKIYPGIERDLRNEHPAIDFLTPSTTRSLFPPVTILFYFPRARKKKGAKEKDGMEGETASSSGESEIGRLHSVHLVHCCYLSRISAPANATINNATR